MTVVVTHTTPADSSFSTTGAAAWNANHTLTGVGTMAGQDANAVTITGGTIDGTTVGATTASTGRFTTVTSTVATGTAPFTVASTTAVANLSIGGNAGTVTNGVYTTDTGTVTNTMLAGSIANAKLTNSSITFGSTAQALGSTVSAISGVTIDNGAIGGTTPAAGTFTTLIGGGGSANYEQITGGATGKAVQFQSLGSDTNISQAIQSKGTGAIDLAAGSSGVNISNGGTVTAITRTSAGTSYTSQPTVAITAPTTAGGVQATATVTIVLAAVSSIAGGGTGYTAGDVLTISGGTSAQTAQLTVSTVSAGVITAVTVSRGGDYTVAPSNPASVTGGTGSGATFNLTFGILTFTITNAGSGYVEQPTVTFSGGGGSGAAAYATVGAEPTIRSLFGSSTAGLAIATAAGAQVRVADIGDGTRPLILNGGSAGGASSAGIQATSGFLQLSTVNTDTRFYSGGRGATLQFNVLHTASAVNYVQVTGAATGGTVNISSQGSDASVNLGFTAKSGGVIRFFTGNGTENFRIASVSSTVNYISASGAIAGASPSFAATGTDADIDLTLTPKGAGAVRFGTYTASALLAVAGYITIKDSGGTTRRLLVG